MRSAITPALLTLAFALSACSNGTDGNGDGTISREEVAEAASAIKLQPGQWEHKIEIVDVSVDESKLSPEEQKFLGAMMKAMVGKVTTNTSCLTEEEAAKPDAAFLAGTDKDECTYDRFDVSGGKIDAAIRCAGKENGETGTFTMLGDYQSDSYTMAMTMDVSSPQMGVMKMKAKNSARRIGECAS